MVNVQDGHENDQNWVEKQLDAFSEFLLRQREPVLTRELFLRWSSDQDWTESEKEAVWSAFEAERGMEEL